jgi:hypothetical protein
MARPADRAPRGATPGPGAYWEELTSAADAALATTETVEHHLRVGERNVRLRFAGPALIPLLLPSLSHLEVPDDPGHPELSIDLWDGGTGVPPPPLPWEPGSVGSRGEVTGYNEDGFRTVFQVDPLGFRALTMFDSATLRVCFWVLAPEYVPWWERAAPLRIALHFGLSGPRRRLLHAGAVGVGGRGVLLAGPGGSGKSTTAVAAMLEGLDYAGDDYLLLDLEPEVPVAHSLYASAKLVPETGRLLPELRSTLTGSLARDGEKHVVDVRSLASGKIRTSLPVTAIVFPSAGQATELVEAAPADALRRLAPSTIFQLPYDGGASLAPLAELVRRVPAYVLGLGGSPEAAVVAINGLLADARAA